MRISTRTRTRSRRVVVLAVTVAAASACGSSADGETADASTTEAEPPASDEPAADGSAVVPVEAATGITGIWAGTLSGMPVQFRLEDQPGGEVEGFFDSLAEGVTDIPSRGSVDESTVTLQVEPAGATFNGTLEGDKLDGTWSQAGTELPLELERQSEPLVLARPQQPEPPYPYETTDVEIPADGFSLAGTLTVPEGDGPFPTVVLISGSGPQDRDETLAGHKPFLVIADALARTGIASLRYDDRGIEGSGGTFAGATTADFAADATAAVNFLSGNPAVANIGLIGHSEGGLSGPMVASQSAEVDYLIMLAGPGLPGRELLVRQQADVLEAEGMPSTVVEWQATWGAEMIEIAASELSVSEAQQQMTAVAEAAVADMPPETPPQLAESDPAVGIETWLDPWMRAFLRHDPAPVLGQVDVPVLALFGELDVQVAADVNAPAVEAALSANDDTTVVTLPGLNHLFQHAETGAVSQYGVIEETFAPEALDLIIEWIGERG